MTRSGLITALLLVAVLMGVGAASYLVMRQPQFWFELGSIFVEKSLPEIVRVLTKRNSPEIEKEMATCVRRGGQWDNFNKRCRS